MIYNFNLKTVGIIIGCALMIGHLLAILHAKEAKGMLKAFPRSKSMGAFLLGIVTLWAFWLVATMDLGEFSSYRTMLKIVVPVAGVLCFQYVDEFLPVRALGMLMLLLAEPLLEAAFLRPEGSRLLLVILAYAWIIAGMFWVGMPYLMRDLIGWVVKSHSRWVAACLGGAAYGAALLFSAMFFYQRS
jgi:hypothetical protein